MTSTRRRLSSKVAFTITELLVVIGIIVLLIALAVPAFSSLLASSERALAENQLKAGLAAARDAAIQSEAGDGAAVFFFTPGGRVTIVSCVSVGEIDDYRDFRTTLTVEPVRREVFVPVATSEPLQMPKGWSVRGFVTGGLVYAGNGTEPWYASYFDSKTPTNGAAGWVFPETGFYDADADIGATGNTPSGARRNSFMVRFKVGSGELDLNNSKSALVFDPIPQQGTFRTQQPFARYRSDQLRIGTSVADNYAAYVRRVINNSAIRPAELRTVLGFRSPDTVLVRPVTELALYQESHLAAGIDARELNKATGTLYGQRAGRNALPLWPEFDDDYLPAGVTDAQDLAREITEWIEGGARDGADQDRHVYDARIYSLSRYMGSVQEVKP